MYQCKVVYGLCKKWVHLNHGKEKFSKSGQGSKTNTPKALGTNRDYAEADFPNSLNGVLATHHAIY